MVNKDIKAKWIAALKGGKFEQGKGNLLRNGRYCCLGVLRHVMNPDDTSKADGGGEMLSRQQLVSAGLNDDVQRDLSALNDSGLTFAGIADYIEENL